MDADAEHLCRHLQLVWGASADFWQSQWDRFLLAFGDDQFRLRVVGEFCCVFFIYFPLNYIPII